MVNEKHEDYQYNRCISRGICSINPATASLQEVILLYLKYASFYGLKLEECGIKDKRLKNFILNTIAVLSSNYEISEANFGMINSTFQTELPKSIKYYNEACGGTEKPDINLPGEQTELNEYIRFGEKEFNKKLQNIENDERNLYRILFILIKSICINILVYESYEHSADEEILSVYKVLNLFNTQEKSKDELKKLILDFAEKDSNLMTKISIAREERYGEQDEHTVSFSTTKGKAVLVVGSNIRELEQILDVFKDKNTDIYTHDNMIIAHSFPKFREYKNLKGQFGQGMENCLLDFSTFPGPIIFTRYSLFNVENLYRGRLFTTDFSYSKGVIKIENNDFTEVIKTTEESKGFKTGKVCEPETVGFSFGKAAEKIKNSLEYGSYTQVVIIASEGYTNEEKEYFSTLLKHLPENILVISLNCCKPKSNVICINASNDIYGTNRLINEIFKICRKKITLIYPHSDRHILSVIINSAGHEQCEVFLGNWNRTVINPNITDCLKADFSVSGITTPKNDINKILNVK